MANAPRTMPKAPAIKYLPTPPPGRRVYAHIVSASVACPRCGTLHALGGQAWRKAKRRRMSGYDAHTGTFRCKNGGCRYLAILGVVFWPVRQRNGRHALPADHVLTPGEAAAARLEASYEAGEVIGEAGGVDTAGGEAIGPPGGTGAASWAARAKRGRLQRTNVECTCGEPCPVHGAVEEDADVG